MNSKSNIYPLWEFFIRGHSQTMLTRFWLFLTTYPPASTCSTVWTNVRFKKTVTIHSSVISHSTKSIWVNKPSFCQNDPPHRITFLAKGQLDNSYTFWTMANYSTVDCDSFFETDVMYCHSTVSQNHKTSGNILVPLLVQE